jgi:hypothetical protein
MLGLMALSISGCITTQIRGYSNPDRANFVAKKIAVFASAKDIGIEVAVLDGFIEKLGANGVHSVDFKRILPPVRTYTNDEVLTALRRNGVDSVLEINIGGGDIQTVYLGSQTHGTATSTANASFYGNSAYVNGQTNYSGSSMPIYGANRTTTAEMKLLALDGESSDTVWVSSAKTEAGGKLFVTDNSTADSLATDTVNELVKVGHVVPPKK